MMHWIAKIIVGNALVAHLSIDLPCCRVKCAALRYLIASMLCSCTSFLSSSWTVFINSAQNLCTSKRKLPQQTLHVENVNKRPKLDVNSDVCGSEPENRIDSLSPSLKTTITNKGSKHWVEYHSFIFLQMSIKYCSSNLINSSRCEIYTTVYWSW